MDATVTSHQDLARADSHLNGNVDFEPALQAGVLIGKYRVLFCIGSGGMAEVYLAVAQGPGNFNKLLVLKLLRPEMQGKAELVKMFLQEAQLAARLSHANIIQTFEVLELESRHVLVMEYMSGESLGNIRRRSFLRHRALPSIKIQIGVIANILAGLHHAHELEDYDGTALGLVHRDVTPGNIFVTDGGDVKLLDFGIARVDQSERTRTGILKGTIRYMAPETVEGKVPDRRADLFALGVIIWESVAQQRMWPKEMSDYAVMENVVHGRIPELSKLRPETPPALVRICARALSTDRDQRYDSAEEFRQDLLVFLRDTDGIPTQEELASCVKQLFESERAKRKTAIADSLKVFGRAPERPNYFQGGSDTDLTHADSTERRSWPKTALLALPLIALGIAYVWGTKTPTVTTTVPPTVVNPAPVQPSALVPRVEPQLIVLTIEATPPSASLLLDGKPIENPTTLTRPMSTESHTIEASLDGYLAVKKVIDFQQSQGLHWSLSPVKAEADKAVPPKATKKPRRSKHNRVSRSAQKNPPIEDKSDGEKNKPPANSDRPKLDSTNPWAR